MRTVFLIFLIAPDGLLDVQYLAKFDFARIFNKHEKCASNPHS